ncbi:MAG: hypothetical protein ACE5JP_16375 [Candidatus Bipolaricaulia bacterium]
MPKITGGFVHGYTMRANGQILDMATVPSTAFNTTAWAALALLRALL